MKDDEMSHIISKKAVFSFKDVVGFLILF